MTSRRGAPRGPRRTSPNAGAPPGPAGGSEVHASNVAKRWAAAGLDVQLRTSYAQGRAPVVTRDGYRVIRRAGRYLVFPRAAITEALNRNGRWDALVEIWNGMPFFSP